MIPFNFHHLYYFYKVAKLGSITQASREIGIGQPALSTQLKMFQDYLGKKLFEREGRKIVVTGEGRQVLLYAERIFDAGTEMLRALEQPGHSESVRTSMGVSDEVPRSYLEALLDFLIVRSPRSKFGLTRQRPERMGLALREGTLDFALIEDLPHLDPEEECRLVHRLPMVFAIHPSLAKSYKTFPECLDGAPLILPSHGSVRNAANHFFVRHHVRPHVVAEVQDVEIARHLAEEKRGVALLDEHGAASGKNTLLTLNPLPTGLERTVYLLWRRKRPHPLIAAILEDFNLHADTSLPPGTAGKRGTSG